MTDLEKLLRDDLHDVAGSFDPRVSLAGIAAEHARLRRRTTIARIALVAAAAIAAGAVWWASGTLWGPPDTAVPNPLQTPQPTPSVTSAPSSPSPSPSPSSSRSSSPAGQPSGRPSGQATTTPGAPVATRTALVYYVRLLNGEYRLVPEQRQVPAATPARGAVEALLAGPLDPDYQSLWPSGTRVLGISYTAGVITVDLSAEARTANIGASGEEFLVRSLVDTLVAAYGPTDRVMIRIEGQPAGDAWGHFVWNEPIASTTVANDHLYPVLIESPTQGATVTAPVVVRGRAATFEANLTWTVRRADGTVAAEGQTMTAEGMTLSAYSFTVDLVPGSYTVTITADDPSGGVAPAPASDTKQFTVR